MPLYNCEINLILTWSSPCVITNSIGTETLAIIDTKLYVTVLTLINSRYSAKLLQLLKSDFKRTVNWNKYQSKVLMERQNQNLDYLVDPSFQRVDRLFVLSFEDNAHRTRDTGYFLPKVEVKDQR